VIAWILRIILVLAAPIAALFISRGALNFGIVETLVAVILIAGFAVLAAVWTLRRPGAGGINRSPNLRRQIALSSSIRVDECRLWCEPQLGQ